MLANKTESKTKSTRKTRKCYDARLDVSNPRKQKMILETFEFLEKGHLIFYHSMLAFMGGCDLSCAKLVVTSKDFFKDVDLEPEVEMSGELTSAKRRDDNEKVILSPELFMANCTFRIVPLQEISEPCLDPAVLCERFQKYSGKVTNNQVETYFNSKYDSELYGWKDMRIEFDKLAAEMHVSTEDLRSDLAALFQDKLLGNKNGNGWNLVSSLFGNNQKAPRTPKLDLYLSIVDCLENVDEKKITEEHLAKIYLQSGNCRDASELKDKFFKTGTTPIVVKECFSADPYKFIAVKNKIKFFKDRLGVYQREYGFKCKSELMSYFVNQIGSFDFKSWSEMLNNAMASIKSKTTRNCNFVLEKMQAREKMVQANAEYYDLANGYFESKFNIFQEPFVIKKSHVCTSEIEGLYSDWLKATTTEAQVSKNSDEKSLTLDEIIDKYVDNCSYDSKQPIPSLLYYLHSIREKMTAKQLLAGLDFGRLKMQIENHKIHPMVPNNPTFNFGLQGKISGKIFSPEDARKHKTKIGLSRGLSPAIWMTLDVFVDGKWESHHFNFWNTRFQQEIYAMGNAGGNASEFAVCNSRSPRSGYRINPILSQDQIQIIRDEAAKKGDKSRVKVVKNLVRLEAAREQNLLPCVAWNDNWNIGMQRNGKEFNIFVSQVHEVNKPNNAQAFLSYDLNQYSNNTYTVSKITDESDPDTLLFNGRYVKLVENGFITACVSVGKGEKQKQFDQLSYDGVPWENIQDWVNSHKEFITKWRNIKQKNNQGEPIDIDLVAMFEKMNLYKPSLYNFNKRCCQLVKKTLKDKSPEELQTIRSEIFDLIKNGKFAVLKLSSLNQHSFDMFRNAKSLISSYFNNLLGPRKSDEEKQAADMELFALRQECETKRFNKQRGKVDQIASSIVKKAVELQKIYKEVACVGEDLGQMVGGGKKTKINATLQDWASQRIAKRVSELSTYHDGLDFKRLNPRTTSHMNPGVWNNKDHQNSDDKPFRPRWDRFDLNFMDEVALQKLKFFLRGDKKNKRQTSQYYREGMLESLEHYGMTAKQFLQLSLDDFKAFMTVKIEELKEDMPMFPRRGGKFYQATYKVDKDAELICYNGKQFWLTNADIVASVNLALLYILNHIKKS